MTEAETSVAVFNSNMVLKRAGGVSEINPGTFKKFISNSWWYFQNAFCSGAIRKRRKDIDNLSIWIIYSIEIKTYKVLSNCLFIHVFRHSKDEKTRIEFGVLFNPQTSLLKGFKRSESLKVNCACFYSNLVSPRSRDPVHLHTHLCRTDRFHQGVLSHERCGEVDIRLWSGSDYERGGFRNLDSRPTRNVDFGSKFNLLRIRSRDGLGTNNPLRGLPHRGYAISSDPRAGPYNSRLTALSREKLFCHRCICHYQRVDGRLITHLPVLQHGF